MRFLHDIDQPPAPRPRMTAGNEDRTAERPTVKEGQRPHGILSILALSLVLLSSIALPLTLAPGLLQAVVAIHPFSLALDAAGALTLAEVVDIAIISGAVLSLVGVLVLVWAYCFSRRLTV